MDGIKTLGQLDRMLIQAFRQGDRKRLQCIEIGRDLHEEISGPWRDCAGLINGDRDHPLEDLYGVPFRVIEGSAGPKLIYRE